jgi:hypothetical protein
MIDYSLYKALHVVAVLLGAVTHFRGRAPASPVPAWSACVSVAALAVVMAIYKPF